MNLSSTIFGVCLVHLLFIIPILFNSPFTPQKKQHKPMVVKTVKTVLAQSMPPSEKKTARPTLSTPARHNPAPVAKQPPPVSKPAVQAPTPKPIEPQARIEKKPPLKKEKPLAKKTPAKEQKPTGQNAKTSAPHTPALQSISPSLLKELEESIAKIEDNRDKHKLSKKPSAKTPLSAIAPLQIDSTDTITEEHTDESGDYISALAGHLHATLHLPDFGEVKIELTLRQDGTVVKLKVLNTESQQNRKYLESHLPLIKFPHLTGSYAKKNEHTFILNFCNEL
jgi:hypothetical protein